MRLKKIKNAIFSKPYIFYFIFAFIFYILINAIVNKVYVGVEMLPNYSLHFLIPYLFFNIIFIPLLVAISVNLSIIKFKEMKSIKGGGLTFAGLFGGILGGACPGCFVGLFPAFLGLFGIGASLSALPFYGLEIQIFSSMLLIAGIILLTRETVCMINLKT